MEGMPRPTNLGGGCSAPHTRVHRLATPMMCRFTTIWLLYRIGHREERAPFFIKGLGQRAMRIEGPATNVQGGEKPPLRDVDEGPCTLLGREGDGVHDEIEIAPWWQCVEHGLHLAWGAHV